MRSFALALVLAISLPHAAHADDEKAARQAYLEGRRLFDIGEFKPALDAFKRAYLNYEAPGFLYNIAQCHRELGQYPEAIRFYQTYLKLSPNADDRVAVETLIATLSERVQASPRTLPPEAASTARASTTRASTTTPRANEPRTMDAQPGATEARTGAAASTTADAAPPARVPVYKRWWLWTAVGAVAVVAIGVGVGVAVGGSSGSHFTGTLPDWKLAGLLVRF